MKETESMIRSGHYCIYEGEEYRISRRIGNMITIISTEANSIQAGFEKLRDYNGIYQKGVKCSEVDEQFRINTYCVYKGEVFYIRGEIEEKYMIITSDFEKAYEFNMARSDKYEYSLEVSKSDVEVFEERTPLNL